jgi:hypothetical protein
MWQNPGFYQLSIQSILDKEGIMKIRKNLLILLFVYIIFLPIIIGEFYRFVHIELGLPIKYVYLLACLTIVIMVPVSVGVVVLYNKKKDKNAS